MLTRSGRHLLTSAALLAVSQTSPSLTVRTVVQKCLHSIALRTRSRPLPAGVAVGVWAWLYRGVPAIRRPGQERRSTVSSVCHTRKENVLCAPHTIARTFSSPAKFLLQLCALLYIPALASFRFRVCCPVSSSIACSRPSSVCILRPVYSVSSSPLTNSSLRRVLTQSMLMRETKLGVDVWKAPCQIA